MGDRGNIKVYQNSMSDSAVYLYTHWKGSTLPQVVQTVLQRGQRWDDIPYLTRMLFDALIDDQHGQETGFGISTKICDNEHPVIAINCHTCTVSFENDDGEPIETFSFEEFCSSDLPELQSVFDKAWQ